MEPPADDVVTRMPIKEELKENDTAAAEKSVSDYPELKAGPSFQNDQPI